MTDCQCSLCCDPGNLSFEIFRIEHTWIGVTGDAILMGLEHDSDEWLTVLGYIAEAIESCEMNGRTFN